MCPAGCGPAPLPRNPGNTARVIYSRAREFVRWLVANRRAQAVPDFAASGRKVMGQGEAVGAARSRVAEISHPETGPLPRQTPPRREVDRRGGADLAVECRPVKNLSTCGSAWTSLASGRGGRLN